MDPLIWPMILVLLAIALIVLEIFVPSGGALSLFAAVAVAASIVVAFLEAFWVGTTILMVDLVAIPVVIGIAVKWWPHTPIGRMVMIHRPASEEDVLPKTKGYHLRETMIGTRGVAVSCLLPSGAVRIDGQTYDAVSDGMPIDPGQAVTVIDVRTQRIVVRPLSKQEIDAEMQSEKGADDILSTPIDSLGIDPFDEPLT